MSFLIALFHFLTTASQWSGPSGILVQLGLQLELSAIVVAAAALFGTGLGFLLAHYGHGGFVAVNAANTARAVPSLALLTLLVLTPSIGLKSGGFLAAFIALFALAVPPVLTNAYTGMREVDPDLREAAHATGMSGAQRFWRIEVPLATPLAFAGIRTAAIEVIATSTLAAYVTFNDLGELIFSGLNQQNNVEAFAGALLVAALAGAVDLLLVGVYRLFTPAVLRRGERAGVMRSRGLSTSTVRAVQKIRDSLGPAAS